jgi:hypothetical protein
VTASSAQKSVGSLTPFNPPQLSRHVPEVGAREEVNTWGFSKLRHSPCVCGVNAGFGIVYEYANGLTSLMFSIECKRMNSGGVVEWRRLSKKDVYKYIRLGSLSSASIPRYMAQVHYALHRARTRSKFSLGKS